jgi:MFS family permease
MRYLSQRSHLDKRFWRLWTATGVSSLGDGMVLVGFPLLALAFTHNALLIAGVAVASRAPAVLVALPAGALADRLNRRRLLLAIEMVRFVVLGAFALAVLAGADGLLAIYATVFVLGALNFAFEVTSAACLPNMVAAEMLVPANAHLETVDLTAEEMVGQAIGGAAFALASVVPFALDACSFAASALLLRASVPDNPPATAETTLLCDLRSGLRWFLHAPLPRLLASLIASFAFCQALVLGVMVLYATRDLHLSAAGYGLLLGVAAIGNIVGAVTASRLHRRLGSAWCIIGAGLAAAVAYPVLAATGSAFVAAGALTLESAGVVLGGVAARSLRQSVVPAEMQGRAASAYLMVVLGALTLGGLTGGLLTDQLGLRPTFLIAGCLQLAVVVVAATRLMARVRQGLAAQAPLSLPEPAAA